MIPFSIHQLGKTTCNHDMVVVQKSPDFSHSQRCILRLFLISGGFSPALLLDTTFFFNKATSSLWSISSNQAQYAGIFCICWLSLNNIAQNMPMLLPRVDAQIIYANSPPEAITLEVTAVTSSQCLGKTCLCFFFPFAKFWKTVFWSVTDLRQVELTVPHQQ